jgi:hypothetical protein
MPTERLHRHAGGRRALADRVRDDAEAADREDARGCIRTIHGRAGGERCEKKRDRRRERRQARPQADSDDLRSPRVLLHRHQ